MSGAKEFSAVGLVPAALIGAAGVAALAGLAAAGVGVGAYRAYQFIEKSIKQSELKAKQRQKEIEDKIAEVKKTIRSSSPKIVVDLPDEVAINAVQQPTAEDFQELQKKQEIELLKGRMLNIKTQYQSLVDRGFMDDDSTFKALKNVSEALDTGDLKAAKAHIQALDDARIKSIQQQEVVLEKEADLLQQRLDSFRSILPVSVVGRLQTQIDRLQPSLVESTHEELTRYQLQAEAIAEAGEKMVTSWQEVGYEARALGIDEDALVVEVETHEGANTQVRIPFSGETIQLEGPPEEEGSCASRTIEALQTFAKQGYYLEFDKWDGQPVPDELRYLGLDNEELVVEELEEKEKPVEYYQQSKTRRTQQLQGH